MSRIPETPRSHAKVLDPKTPTGARPTAIQSSPHYATARRHSLYGTEDRVVLDPGSRVWKVGFSGEGRPRDVCFVGEQDKSSLWSLSRPNERAEEEEEEKMLEAKMQERLRTVFHQSLLADPRSRKVIIVEHPLLPLYVKDVMARILFNNLQIPSISFASSHLLSLLAVGRITGLVIDCGYLESTVLPIFASRPLFPQLRTTPLAGSRLTSHLRALLLLFGTYISPLSSLGTAANIPTASRSMRVPEEVLTDAVMEEIKTRCCFVGDALDFDAHAEDHDASFGDGSTEFEVPSSGASLPESDFSRVSADTGMSANSGFSIVSNVHTMTDSSGPRRGEGHLQALANLYNKHSSATDLTLRVDPPVSQNTGTGRGTLVIPGWVRERAAEVLFEGGDVDESSVAEVLLDSLLKVPVDLRKIMASSILVVGGTPMLPGFIPRLQTELLRALTREPKQRQSIRPNSRYAPPSYDPYAPLRPLIPHIAILNNPAPLPAHLPPTPTASSGARSNAGRAPAFMPATLPWVGGSLAGALKISGEEISREKWDEADTADDEDDNMEIVGDPQVVHVVRRPAPLQVLPDWTRPPLKLSAPLASKIFSVPAVTVQTPRSVQRMAVRA